MKERISIITLAVVVIVAIIGLVILINASKTGMVYIYNDPIAQQWSRPTGSGEQTSYTIQDTGFTRGLATSGTENLGEIGTASRPKKLCGQNPMCIEKFCYPVIDGQLIVNPNRPNEHVAGTLQSKESINRAGSQSMLDRCYEDFDLPADSVQTLNIMPGTEPPLKTGTAADMYCCIGQGQTITPSGLGGSATGAAYTYKPALRTYQ